MLCDQASASEFRCSSEPEPRATVRAARAWAWGRGCCRDRDLVSVKMS